MENPLVASKSSEATPLLQELSTPVVSDQETTNPPKTSIFSCAVICILFTELCERLTHYGISTNLVLFATREEQLDMSPANASILTYIFIGICYTVPIAGGWLADSKLGHFTVICYGTSFYIIGTILIPIGCITDHPIEKWAANSLTTNTAFKRAVYISALFICAFGTGAIKANVAPFGAEQVAHQGPEVITKFFSMFYAFIYIGVLFSNTFIVYIQQNISYFYGNFIPAGSLVMALIIFLSGKSNYEISPPTESVFSTTLRIVKEAIKRSRRPSISSTFVDHWLDRAKMCFGGPYNSAEVEGVKKICRLLPILASLILFWTVYGQVTTSMLYQGEYADIKVGSFVLPVASLSQSNIIVVLILIPFMDKVGYPLLATFDIRPSQLQRMGIGMVFATASMVCAGGIEWYRVEQCCILQDRGEKNMTSVSSMSVFTLIPQYTLVAFSEVFTTITAMEFCYTEAPKSLQGFVIGVYTFTSGLGSFVGALLVLVVNAVTGAVGGPNSRWYPDKDRINKGHHFAYFFFLLSVVMFVNFILFIFVALNYKAKKELAERMNFGNRDARVDHEIPRREEVSLTSSGYYATVSA